MGHWNLLFSKLIFSSGRAVQLHHCREREKYLHSLQMKETDLNNQLSQFDEDRLEDIPEDMNEEFSEQSSMCQSVETEEELLKKEIEDMKIELHAFEDKICAVNNIAAELEARLKSPEDDNEETDNLTGSEMAKLFKQNAEKIKKVQLLKMHIEAQLFLNLR